MKTSTAADHLTTTLSQALTKVLSTLELASIDDVTLGAPPASRAPASARGGGYGPATRGISPSICA